MTENADVIKVEGLTKVFNNSLTAVDHIDFSTFSIKSWSRLNDVVDM